MLLRVNQLMREQRGQDLIEYGLLAALIAAVVVIAVGSVGTTLNDFFWVRIANSPI
jgi:Flp pilus assembly pilin Flp